MALPSPQYGGFWYSLALNSLQLCEVLCGGQSPYRLVARAVQLLCIGPLWLPLVAQSGPQPFLIISSYDFVLLRELTG